MRRLIVIVLRAEFEESSGTLAATDAHRDDAKASAATDHFTGDCSHKPRAGHAERMTDRDRAAIDVELVRVDPQPVATIDDLDSKSFIQLPYPDVANSQVES